jgi:hypothetical protein
MVASCLLDHVGYELGCDRCAIFILLVLPRIWKKWNHGRNPFSTSSPTGMDHNAELHQGRVDGTTTGVDNVHIVLSNGFMNAHIRFTDEAVGYLSFRNWDTDAMINSATRCHK